MQCPNCGHENSADARFCSQCGHALSITCPECSTVSELGAKFCSSCGASLTEPAPAPSAAGPTADLARYLPEELLAKMRSARAGQAMLGERRTVTMVFADIQGSTSAAEQLDPEDWAEIMNGAYECLISPIYRYEGTLAKLMGDAVLAFFGAPIAHEDDPVRAIRAGLEITEAMESYSAEVEHKWGVAIQIRVGINTGLVVVGAMGSDLRVEYTALGDAINVAARMEQTAEPGTVRVTGHTLSLTGGVFEAEEIGPVSVKGKAEPVPAFEVTRHVGKPTDRARIPLIGREEELAELEELRSRLLSGTGYIASIIGEGGVGKSRLLEELEARTAASLEIARRFDEHGDISWLSASARSYDSTTPLSTISELLSRWWVEGEAEATFSAVESAVAQAGLEDDPDLAAYLGYIAGVPLRDEASRFIKALETPVLHARAGEALKTYLSALATKRPTLLVFEDLHWADDLSLALVEEIMDMAENRPIGLLITMRPYREDAAWHIHEVADRDHHHRYLLVNLELLEQSKATAMLASLLEGASLSDDIKKRILERSEGNPLYIEEMARSVKEMGAEQAEKMTVPTSLNGMLSARLDRLGEESRYVAQVASVLGSEVEREMLAVLLDEQTVQPDITDLLRRGILTETPGRPGSLSFRHALLQEAAYQTILRRTRRELHRRVAAHLIDMRPDAAEDIARHLVEAGDTADAFPYLVEAGQRATRSMALADAIRLLTTAVENTPDQAEPELVEKAHNILGDAYALVPDLSQAAATYQRLYEYGEKAGRPEARVAALNRLGFTTATLSGDFAQAKSYLEDARRLAEEAGDDLGMAEYHMNACFIASMAGQPGTAVQHDEATVEFGEKTGVSEIRMSGMVRRATNYIALLDFENGVPAIEKGLEEARRGGLEEGEAIVDAFGTAIVEAMRGDIRTAVEVADRAQTVLERYGSFYTAMNQGQIGVYLYELGDLEGSMSRFVDARRTANKMGQGFMGGGAASGMALVYATAGMSDQAAELRAESEQTLSGPMGEFVASTAWAYLGWASILADRAEDAIADFSRGLAASSYSRFMDRPRLLTGQALAKAATDDLTGADETIAEAQDLVDEKSLTVYRAHVGLAAGELLWRRRELDRAEETLAAAYQTAMEAGQRLMAAWILRARSRLAREAGREGEARAHAEAVLSAVETMCGSMADETLRESFRAKWLQDVGKPSTEALP